MFKLFKKKSKVEQLQSKYQKLMEQAFQLSKSNRMESDKKYAEAQEILKQIESMNVTN